MTQHTGEPTPTSHSTEQAVQALLASLESASAGEKLAALIGQGLDRLPLPGSGATLVRWRALAAVAAHDLSLAKLYEGHTDALSILAQLHAPAHAEHLRWGTWCAEPPNARVQVEPQGPTAAADNGGAVRLSGHKPWCSGAQVLDQALVSGWLADGQRCLVAVSMHQPGVRIDTSHWQAVGMAGSASHDVHFEHAHGTLVGAPGQYLSRAGFVHGGAGVAACWYGGASGIAAHVRQSIVASKDPYRLAHLGAIDVALSSAAALLRQAGAEIDHTPSDSCALAVARARLAVEAAAEQVLRRVPRAIGPGPLCQRRSLASLMADLPVFMRQSHAERDQAALGAMANQEADPWSL